jgi:hypothetical protein
MRQGCDCPVGFDDRESIRYTAALDGQVAQLVEQRTENPRVRGSIPRLATKENKQLARLKRLGFLLSALRVRTL